MQLNEAQLLAGLEAAAKFLDLDYTKRSSGEQWIQRKKIQDWLLPCLIRLPDIRLTENSASELLAQHCFSEDFRRAAVLFEMNQLRMESGNDRFSDSSLLSRMPADKIETSAQNLLRLTQIFLEAAEAVAGEELDYALPKSLEDLLQDLDTMDLDEAWKTNFS